MSDEIQLRSLAAALSCHPQTISRHIHGPSAPLSKLKESASLALIAQSLHMAPAVLSQFLRDQAKSNDEALDSEFACMILDCSMRSLRRYIKDKSVPVLVNVGHLLRFSRKALAQYIAAQSE